MSLHLEIVTPEKKIFSDTVENVYLPGADGEMGIGSGFAEISQTKAVVLTDMALGESEIDEQATEDAIKRAEEKLQTIDHSLDAEEVAYLQGIIAKQAAALRFKRKYQH